MEQDETPINLDNLTLVALDRTGLREAEWYVETYFDHDGIAFDDRVKSGISELLDHPEFGRFYLIQEGERALGYIVLTFGFDHEFGGRIGWITDFFIWSECRSIGAGGKVMELVEKEARDFGLKALELVTLNHNTAGQRFYTRHGFLASDDRTDYVKLLT